MTDIRDTLRGWRDIVDKAYDRERAERELVAERNETRWLLTYGPLDGRTMSRARAYLQRDEVLWILGQRGDPDD